ncbi:hypothetical protein PM082_024338 [Marasmius tenuissimus]|nr:hypothetical protein PM082_024338 [Marasmius tenuissimus]
MSSAALTPPQACFWGFFHDSRSPRHLFGTFYVLEPSHRIRDSQHANRKERPSSLGNLRKIIAPSWFNDMHMYVELGPADSKSNKKKRHTARDLRLWQGRLLRLLGADIAYPITRHLTLLTEGPRKYALDTTGRNTIGRGQSLEGRCDPE